MYPDRCLYLHSLAERTRTCSCVFLNFVCSPFCSNEQQEYKVMLTIATVALCCKGTQASWNESWVKPLKQFPLHCFLHDSYWYQSTQQERAFCCEFTLDLVHYSNICWIICGLFSSLLKFSTKHVFFKCNALLFFPFINLGQKSLTSLQCKSFMSLQSLTPLSQVIVFHQDSFMNTKSLYVSFIAQLMFALHKHIIISTSDSSNHCNSVHYAHTTFRIAILAQFNWDISKTEAKFLKCLKLQDNFVLAVNHVFSKTRNSLDKFHNTLRSISTPTFLKTRRCSNKYLLR